MAIIRVAGQDERERARQEHALFAQYLPIARDLARRFQRHGQPLDELVRAGALGLVKAIDRFSHGSAEPFHMDAVGSVIAELRAARAADARFRGGRPRPIDIAHAIDRLPAPAPAIGAVADELKVDVEYLLEALHPHRRRW